MSKSEAERAREILDRHKSYGRDAGSGRSDNVPEEDCRRMRDLAREGLRPSDISARDDVDRSRQTVQRHVVGNCSHDVEGDARRQEDQR